MKYNFISRLSVAYLATVMFLVCFVFMFASNSSAAPKKNMGPDFAYPKTVNKNARAALQTAIAHGNWPAAADAAIQSVTAANLVSNENAMKGIATLDSISKIAPDSWKPVFQLIQAHIFNEIYNSMRWKADSRNLPLDSVPDNPYLWSRNIFADKVYALCKDVIESKENKSRLLSEWNSFLTDTSEAIDAGMTVDEFTLRQSFQLLNEYSDASKDVIPFFPNIGNPVTPSQKCAALRDKAIDMLIDKTASLNQSLFHAQALVSKSETLPYSQRIKFLTSALGKVKGTEGEQLILMSLRDYAGNFSDYEEQQSVFPYSKAEYVDILKKSVVAFPKGMYSNALRNIIEDFTHPDANIEFANQYLTSSSIKMDVTLSNCNDCWILVYDYSPYVNATRAPKTKVMASSCRLVKAVKVSANGVIPFSSKVSAEIGKLPVGTYVVVPSATADGKGIFPSIQNDTWRQTFTLSDISIMTVKYPDAKTGVYVVDGADGRPIEGATVKVYNRPNYSAERRLAKTLTTDKDGSVMVTEEKFEIEASFNGSKWSNRMRMYNSNQKPDTVTRKNIQILADRSIYHPGDSISAALIAYSSRLGEMKLIKEMELDIKLFDANGREVSVQSTVTDSFGRTVADFKIPEQGMLGRWRLTAVNGEGKQLGSSFFQVSDYVAPTFFVTSEHSDEDINPGDVVKIKGRVLTYSGMPVADAEVKYSVSYTPPARWFVYSMGTFDSSVTTDSEGRYEISLPTDNLKGTQFERGLFTVNVSAVSPAGETQKGPVERFAIGKDYHIYSPYGGSKLEISNGIPAIHFTVSDILGNAVKKELKYCLVNKADGKTVAEGSFLSPTLNIPSRNYESAAYDLKVSLADDPDVNSNLYLVFWRKSDKTAPAGVKLWIPEFKVTAEEGQTSVDVTVGSGIPERWILAMITGSDNVASVRWIHIGKENVSIPVEVPSGKRPAIIDVCYLSDLKVERGQIFINSAWADDNLKICSESFRDKVSAGDKEHWSFRFSRKHGSVSGLPALAVMTDAALNAIAPFNWNFSPSAYYPRVLYQMNAYGAANEFMSFALKSSKYLSYRQISYPYLNDYGQGWGLGYAVYQGVVKNEVMFYSAAESGAAGVTSRSMKKSSMPLAASAVVVREDVTEMAMDDSDAFAESVEEESMITGNGNAPADKEQLRPAEYPIAFFKPYLNADGDGMVNIDFTVPNFNTTWALQVIGYDESLQTAKIALETVASKPVMVSTHSPRFVRTGDVIELTATVFNNTGSSCSPSCSIELVDLISGKTVAVEQFEPESIPASGSRLITMTWTAPSDLSSVGFRAYAESDGHRDGEQALLPVLPASSPVVESTPFWFAPKQKEMEIKLPKFNDTDQVTLQYCDNPAWYCLTALPDIVNPDSKNVTSKVRALFGNAVAYHLISSNSNLKDGLAALLSDSNSQFAALKSNLEKDGNLKIVDLNNTPWVNNAESETLRMSRLSSLLDDKLAKTTIDDILKDIKELQSSDGGWSWCPEMKSSSFITREVLRHFAMMHKDGALAECDGVESMIKSGIRYVDAETVNDYKKYYKKGESLSYLLDWLFVRSSFGPKYIPAGSIANEMSSIANKATKDIASEWKDMGIGSKAMAAMVLYRYGNHKVAAEILESLRQFASETPEKGMWFDNLNPGWGGMTTIRTTTLVLEALAEIQPANGNIDSLRQWLVLGRQYQDWGKNTSIVETVNAILTSGSDWTSRSDKRQPEFYLKGKKIRIPATAALTGAFTLNLNANEASKKNLKVTRFGDSPAWGGVISQYESPILEVKSADVPELSIRKSIVAMVPGENGELVAKENVALKKGMKVRVTLFITVGRDMDYVAVTDERSACLEPDDQLSGYTASDGKFFYREVRNSSTNLFFEWLPKGNHVISYDCSVSQEGEFSCGIATIQSQYSPLAVAHSSGALLHVK